MTSSVTTPIAYFEDPRRFADHAVDVLDTLREVAESDEFILKSRVADLERAIADRTGAGHAIAAASATGALTLVLTALAIGPGDEVVTPAFSFVSSASTVALRGARPVFADVNEDTACLDVDAARGAMTAHTRAMLPAYLFCTAPDMPVLRQLAAEYGADLVEDSAVALGAIAGDRAAGRHGRAAVFSFFPAKPLGGIGDGGMVVTDDDQVAGEIRMLRNHGQDLSVRFLHHRIGFNSRMDEVNAGFLLRRLRGLDRELTVRRDLAHRYDDCLSELAEFVRTPPSGYDGRAVYTYVIRAQRRDELHAHLRDRGIETAIYYPTPLHLQPAFGYLGHRAGEFPVAERLAGECLALPLHPGVPVGDIDRVGDEIAAFYASVR